MREIKFQYIWKHESSIATAVYTLDEIQQGCAVPPRSLGSVKRCWERVAVRQCTGMKDSSNTDVYEGDIVESYFYWPEEKCKAVVTYTDSDGAFSYNNGDGEQDAFVYGELYVIGNIHQNPELLEK